MWQQYRRVPICTHFVGRPTIENCANQIVLYIPLSNEHAAIANTRTRLYYRETNWEKNKNSCGPNYYIEQEHTQPWPFHLLRVIQAKCKTINIASPSLRVWVRVSNAAHRSLLNLITIIIAWKIVVHFAGAVRALGEDFWHIWYYLLLEWRAHTFKLFYAPLDVPSNRRINKLFIILSFMGALGQR